MVDESVCSRKCREHSTPHVVYRSKDRTRELHVQGTRLGDDKQRTQQLVHPISFFDPFYVSVCIATAAR
jgi:hypothetical protein